MSSCRPHCLYMIVILKKMSALDLRPEHGIVIAIDDEKNYFCVFSND